ncbi:ADP-ribosylation factor-like protein 4C [Armadillidium nasatum]|uniref:ADP-ribosylation factor-like protein 4C n=1 Tax=Armadillidium nasatum TaxID=96803 RepID=A0A5N5TEV4_9CRUS|nr:ADP-ribosylation factor-like protein 4C [Armadillidium nasatum]
MCSCLWNSFVRFTQSFLWEATSIFKEPYHAVLVGLDSSGKTTVLFRLRYGQYVNAVPTVGFNMEKVRTGGKGWIVWDVGGAERVRPLWRSYTRATDALIFVVDSSSSEERLEEARMELHKLTKQQSLFCSSVKRPRPPLLILANKQDLPTAREPSLLTKALGLQDLQESQQWMISPVCAVTGEGLDEAMSSLSQLIVKSKKSSPLR